MHPPSTAPAAIAERAQHALALSGSWTARGLGGLGSVQRPPRSDAKAELAIDAAQVEALDTAGAWALHRLLQQLREEGGVVSLHGLRPEFAKLLAAVEAQSPDPTRNLPLNGARPTSTLSALGRTAVAALQQGFDLLVFIGECSVALARCVAHPTRFRGRTVLYNLRSAGVDALPIVGLLSFLLGIVVAYQGADQLRRYGANIFVADLIGLSMLREFAPLITAIIIAGRSGSAYTAQIGTMVVTEEIDAMRTIGIAPLDLLVLPKIIALTIALPLLTVFADVLGVFGGMIMARAQLGVDFGDFLDRFALAVSVTAFLIGICKAPIFAIIIAVVGCFQGFRTTGGADSVGRQTTRSVVQAIFLVIVADALFSIAFSALDL